MNVRPPLAHVIPLVLVLTHFILGEVSVSEMNRTNEQWVNEVHATFIWFVHSFTHFHFPALPSPLFHVGTFKSTLDDASVTK